MKNKHSIFILAALCIAIASLPLAVNWLRAARAEAEPLAVDPAALPESYGTNAVVALYEALLADEPPTIEKEREIFVFSSATRGRLAWGPAPKGYDEGEPMRRTPAQLRARELRLKQIDAAGPVVLEYLRENKDWFLPPAERRRNLKKAINISCFARFVRDLQDHKTPSNWGFVLVLLPQAIGEGSRTLVFSIRDGKIDPDAIRFDGFGGRSLLEEVLKQKEPVAESKDKTSPAAETARGREEPKRDREIKGDANEWHFLKP